MIGKGRPSKLPENLKIFYNKQLKISKNKKKGSYAVV